jgi:aspartyl-tRNA(Asn)/glutamyl-tRNA(Gln) amidotransferase subunit B
VSGGGKVTQETRAWSEAQNKTLPMRSKEDAMDYRYFPDPDLPPLQVTLAQIEAVRAALPELPEAKRARFIAEFGLTAADAQVLTSHPRISEFFEACVAELTRDPKADRAAWGKRAANFIQSELLRSVTTDGLRAEIPVTAAQLAELLGLIEAGGISGKQGKAVFASMLATGKGAAKLVAEQGLAQVSDSGAIESAVRDVLAKHPDNVKLYRAGKTNVLGFFVGQVMRVMQGAGNPKLVNEVLQKLLQQEE